MSKGNRTGQTGEYYVLYRLSSMGLLASLAPPGAPHTDIFAFDAPEKAMASVQVKTRSNANDGGWLIKPGNIRLVSNFHFFAFVDLQNEVNHHPTTYIVPSLDLAGVIHWIENSKPETIASSLPGIDPIQQIRKKGLNFLLLQSILNSPPPGMPSAWMSAKYLEAWYLISTPLFKKK